MQKLSDCFKDTEKTIKHIEQSTFELSIPSINQLRYVAYHLIRASDTNKDMDVDIKEEITKALHHCQRAKFDAVEIGMTYLLEEIRIFEENYSHIKETLDVMKDYIEYLIKAQQAADELKIIADEEKGRVEYYQKIEPHYEILKTTSNYFKKSEPLIATLVEDNNQKKKASTRRFVTTTLLAIIGIILTATFMVFKIGIFNEKEEKSNISKIDTKSKEHIKTN